MNIFLLLILALLNLLPAFAYPITPSGQKFNQFLDNLDVANRWLPHHFVDWQTGKSIGTGISGTHCSTFVAAAATKLGIYMPTPPNYPLLANAQYFWLERKGEKYGWAYVDNHVLAQQIANQGCFVVIAYANPNRARPGHIAIIRPSEKSKWEINTEGPQIIQAGKKNYNSTTLSHAFKHHQRAFQRQTLAYYAHSTPFCQLIAQKEERGHSAIKRL